jgi:hypothetical protein
MAPNTLPGLQDKDGNAAESDVINSDPLNVFLSINIADSA